MSNLARRVTMTDNALIVGITKCGKSHFTASMILSRCHLYDHVILMTSKTEDNILWRIRRPNFSYINYSIKVLEDIWTMAEAARNNGTKLNILLVLDDFLGNIRLKGSTKSFNKDEEQRDIWNLLACQSRHVGITSWFLVQTLTNSVITPLRLGCRLHFYFKGLSTSQLKACFEYVTGTRYRRFEDFLEDYNQYTHGRPYSFVFNDRTDSASEKNLFFCYPIKYDESGVYFTEIPPPVTEHTSSFSSDITPFRPKKSPWDF